MDDKNNLIPFTPTDNCKRHDGWTVARQRAFVEALAVCGCVDEACRSVGMSDTSAYNLRLRDPVFAEAWEAALEIGADRIDHSALGRSIRGVVRPIFYKGEQVGEYRHFDERLTMFMLRHRKPERYGKWIEREPPPPPEDQHGCDASMRLIRAMDDFEDEDGAADPPTR